MMIFILVLNIVSQYGSSLENTSHLRNGFYNFTYGHKNQCKSIKYPFSMLSNNFFQVKALGNPEYQNTIRSFYNKTVYSHDGDIAIYDGIIEWYERLGMGMILLDVKSENTKMYSFVLKGSLLSPDHMYIGRRIVVKNYFMSFL